MRTVFEAASTGSEPQIMMSLDTKIRNVLESKSVRKAAKVAALTAAVTIAAAGSPEKALAITQSNRVSVSIPAAGMSDQYVAVNVTEKGSLVNREAQSLRASSHSLALVTGPTPGQVDQGAIIMANLKSPVVLAFALGAIAAFVKSDLKFPAGYQTSISIYLLLALGLKGGVAISKANFSELLLPMFGTTILGALTPLWCFFALKNLLKFSVEDSAALAAHYGSTSAVTFIASLTFMEMNGIFTEGYMPALLTLLEIPGILVALVMNALLKKQEAGDPETDEEGGSSRLKEAVQDVFFGKSILLLLGGLAIGWICGAPGFKKVEPFFVGPFQGILMLFLLELGVIAGNRIRDFLKVGPGLALFAIGAPIINGFLGVLCAKLVGLSIGGATVLAALSASASYIAAPAAVRIAIPEANPAYYTTCSLAVTFPFNIIIGIPLYFTIAKFLYGM
eukprot:CAMPEP_0196667542 /NCGR_PEP_ID=MMETSP1086-20130531/65140_1 /TAXON_ID=77921 /ORGANISM="Cyanoptyche  gloeocystis , Strain SAG4.97" /LENGTH=449 /DNA_ID=CAMNT_0042004881 /DNA_START=81 /DNA_END=1430 /DNA_ORIENTATION=+